ncbi:MAG: hypothetical protein SR1Q7_12535 [Quinella sp. 1Q7]|nr:hypothetical protein [Quinella sp. 1Q7]
MATSAEQKLARQRYKEKNLEVVSFEVKKGMSKQYTQWAAALGLSLSRLVQNSVEEYIANHSGECVPTVAPVKFAPMQSVLTAEQRKILEAVDSLPESSRKALLKFLQTLVDAKSD